MDIGNRWHVAWVHTALKTYMCRYSDVHWSFLRCFSIAIARLMCLYSNVSFSHIETNFWYKWQTIVAIAIEYWCPGKKIPSLIRRYNDDFYEIFYRYSDDVCVFKKKIIAKRMELQIIFQECERKVVAWHLHLFTVPLCIMKNLMRLKRMLY